MPILTQPIAYKRPTSKTSDVVDFVCDTRRSQRLFKRCETPTLPARHALYAQAKKLEYDGDIAGALDFLYKAMMNGERVDSCLKDIAGLLNMMGRTSEAVEFLKAHSDKVVNRAGYCNLLEKLEAELDKDIPNDMPRGVTVTVVDRSLGPVTMALCDRLFPNPGKIRRILYTDDVGFVGAVHFASHSSARKALHVQKLCSEQVSCTWSTLYSDARLRMLESLEKDGNSLASVLAARDMLPAHLSAFGGLSSIPVYREHDPSIPPLSEEELIRIRELSITRAELAGFTQQESPGLVSDISPVSPAATATPTSSFLDTLSSESSPMSSCESMILSALLATHDQITKESISAQQHGLVPFVTRIPNWAGEQVSAVVVPLPQGDLSEATQLKLYADTLSAMASALVHVDKLVQSAVARPAPPPNIYFTPIKAKRVSFPCFKTPSPVIDRNLFT